MSIIIGSARIDERGKLSGGTAGDQKQTGIDDYRGEVSMQNFYIHKKGWYVLRPKSPAHAIAIAKNMKDACNNWNIGYDQIERLGVIKNGIHSTVKTECDCSSLVRACVKEATGIDPGNFTTVNEAAALQKTGLFEAKFAYTTGTALFDGDILVTKTRGHTCVVCSGNPRTTQATQAVKKAETKSTAKMESAQSYSKSVAGSYTCTASSLNIRAGAGRTKPQLGSIPRGKKFVCYGYYTQVGDTKWLYGVYNGITGFASSAYLKK